jgi:exodeoxyribonuclease VII large subunit
MFKRAASLLDFSPRDGEQVIARGRLGVYEPRGDLQLVVESMSRAGKGALFEQYLRLKAKLEAEGLFDPLRKRPLPSFPRAIGVVTSLGGAALHDVVTSFRRRAPHVSLVIAPAQVQGSAAASEMVRAIRELSEQDVPSTHAMGTETGRATIDLVLLVRGGGSMEDLWAFNDESLARAIAACPVPVVTGVGHETDFSIADFVADLRAPTPTAAAELAAPEQSLLSRDVDRLTDALQDMVQERLARHAQTLDGLESRLARPSQRLAREAQRLSEQQRSLAAFWRLGLQDRFGALDEVQQRLCTGANLRMGRESEALHRNTIRLDLTNPQHVLRRGFAWATGSDGKARTHASALAVGESLSLQFADGRTKVNQ